MLNPEQLKGRIRNTAAEKGPSSIGENDILIKNVEISFDNKDTEMDAVVVNRYGVFVIEVKNYSGLLVGNENDFEWGKYHLSEGDNIYFKAVKNPIRQVK